MNRTTGKAEARFPDRTEEGQGGLTEEGAGPGGQLRFQADFKLITVMVPPTTDSTAPKNRKGGEGK